MFVLAGQEPQSAIKKLEHEALEKGTAIKFPYLCFKSEVAKVKYSSDDPVALADFLVGADIRLVRAEYVWNLYESKKLLPRRQEAEGQRFESPSGLQTALVTHQEVKSWANGETEALLCSISHCWESREHPDPCGYQLNIIAEASWWYAFTYAPAPVWLFIDYTSLFQYKREENSPEEKSFRKAMNAMHLLYCHEFTLTLAIRSLTPAHLWKKLLQDGHTILIYHEKSRAMKEVTLKQLTKNLVEYLLRGWCQAELQWSCTRSDSTAHQRIDPGENAEKTMLRAVVALQPELFKERMQKLEFTHRSDTDAVFHLQEKVFLEKVTTCKSATFAHVELRDLLQVLPFYECIKSFTLTHFECDDESLRQLCEWLKDSLRRNVLTEVVIKPSLDLRSHRHEVISPTIVKAVVEVLPENCSLIRLHLIYVNRWPEELSLRALAAAVRKNTTLYDVEVMPEGFWNFVESEGFNRADMGSRVEAFKKKCLTCSPASADAFVDLEQLVQQRRATARSSSVKKEPQLCRALRPPAISTNLVRELQRNSAQSTAKLNLNRMALGVVEAQVLAGMLNLNSRVTKIDLSKNWIGDAGSAALADAIKVHQTVTEIDLSDNQIGDAGSTALADAIKVNQAVTKIDLSDNQIGDAGSAALADAIKVHQTVTMIYLSNNQIGDAGSAALADAIKVNHTVTKIFLSNNKIGDAASAALADAIKVNKTVTKIHLSNNKIGDAGSAALADAIKVNQTVIEILLTGNQIGDAGSAALADAIKVNKTVTNIDLSYNQIGGVGKKALQEAQHVNRTVQIIYGSAAIIYF